MDTGGQQKPLPTNTTMKPQHLEYHAQCWWLSCKKDVMNWRRSKEKWPKRSREQGTCHAGRAGRIRPLRRRWVRLQLSHSEAGPMHPVVQERREWSHLVHTTAESQQKTRPPPTGDIWGLVWDKQEIPFFGTKPGSLTVGRRRGESSVYVRKTELRLQEWKSWWGAGGRQVDGSGCPTSASLILTISLCSPKMTWANACSSQFRAQTETGNMDPFMTRSHKFRAGLCRETETAAGPCRRTQTSPAPASILDTRRRSQCCPLHLSLQRTTMTPPPCAWGRWWCSRAWCRAAAEILGPSGDQKGNLVAVVQLLSWARLCNYVDWSTQGFPVPHHLSEFAETHVHWTDDAI